MECPYCLTSYHPQFNHADVTPHGNPDNRNYIFYQQCPDCKQLILYLKLNSNNNELQNWYKKRDETTLEQLGANLIYPKKKKSKPLSNDIPQEYRTDYQEVESVLEVSPNASAALSRRCLQRLLVEKANVTKKDLYDQIQEVLDSNQLPSHLEEEIDAIRNIGNFAAHPIKSTNSGTIVEVENGEAEWTLEVLEGLFDFYFVSPEKSKQRKNALNKKLQQAGKPQMK